MAKGFKTGGRKKGTPNLLTGTTKEIIGNIVLRELQRLPALMDQLDPKEKADCIFKLLPYILPKTAPVEETEVKSTTPLHKLFEMQTSQKRPAMQSL
ncbi:MAG: hypothetical protein K0M50_09250 [Prolixibacteraceae bacterium]|nr:hypothetical protein [Prolixibacteraceae bacterium]